MSLTDEEILTLLRAEATLEKGFRFLMQKYQEKIYWHIRRIVENHDDADDVIQNTFIKAYRGLNGFEERSSLYTWLYKIATNEAFTFKKSKHSRLSVSLDDQMHQIEEKSTLDFDENQAYKKLQFAIEQLPERQKEVFNLRYFNEMSYQEISTLLNTSEGALKASYHHAVKKIEAALTA